LTSPFDDVFYDYPFDKSAAQARIVDSLIHESSGRCFLGGWSIVLANNHLNWTNQEHHLDELVREYALLSGRVVLIPPDGHGFAVISFDPYWFLVRLAAAFLLLLFPM